MESYETSTETENHKNDMKTRRSKCPTFQTLMPKYSQPGLYLQMPKYPRPG